MFITGIVVSLDEKNVTVRVKFPEKDNLVSWDLTVNQTRQGVYWMPRINEEVNCLMDQEFKRGTVLGSFYTKENPPPVITKEKIHITFEDGSLIEYDTKTKTLFADIGTGTANIKANNLNADLGSGSATIKAKDIIFDGDVIIEKKLTVKDNAAFDKDLNVGGKTDVQGEIKSKSNVSDEKSSMQTMRDQYNGHKHQTYDFPIPSAEPTVKMT